MNKEQIAKLRSEGEAHLYVAISKVDNIVTDEEKVSAFFYSRRANSLVDLLGIDPMIRNQIVDNIKSILVDKETKHWDANNHLDKAISLLKKSKNLGDYTINLTLEKHIEGLSNVAEVDKYLYKESQFLQKLKKIFKSL